MASMMGHQDMVYFCIVSEDSGVVDGFLYPKTCMSDLKKLLPVDALYASLHVGPPAQPLNYFHMPWHKPTQVE